MNCSQRHIRINNYDNKCQNFVVNTGLWFMYEPNARTPGLACSSPESCWSTPYRQRTPGWPEQPAAQPWPAPRAVWLLRRGPPPPPHWTRRTLRRVKPFRWCTGRVRSWSGSGWPPCRRRWRLGSRPVVWSPSRSWRTGPPGRGTNATAAGFRGSTARPGGWWSAASRWRLRWTCWVWR